MAEPGTAAAPDPVLLDFATRLILAHRVKLTAGVPGCTCGNPYPHMSRHHYEVLHARHVATVILGLAAGNQADPSPENNQAADPAPTATGARARQGALL